MTLDEALLDAHARGDQSALVTLYTRAAEKAEDGDAACFFLTQAYVLALEAGNAATPTLYARLKAHGRV
ncbi:MAG: hypothetical protein AAFP85_00085 [Pseudomonadota bacterium]